MSNSQPTPRRTWSYSRPWRLVSVIVLRPLLSSLIKNDWSGLENIPRSGGVILAPNHLSYVDWGVDGLLTHIAGRYPVFLIKDSAFKVKFIGHFLHKAGQLPVYRGRADAALVLKDAQQALERDACVIIYPEATATRDPELWPMVAKTGVARLALMTGAPVIPIAHWGTQDVLPYGSKKPKFFERGLRRKTVRTVVGPAVDLSPWAGRPMTASNLRDATAAIMRAVTRLAGDLRGEQPPALPYDPAAAKPAAAGAAAAEPAGAEPTAAEPAAEQSAAEPKTAL
ncbi:MAG: 1-acyl-sn-glycerol-3-phosphate acyltransferase [Streptosporangiaceae bacterium]|nr:1-acyl-sn-glycerol-3-phosphate acyltransferase [Streptosporangiaceae bacterium]